MICILSHDIIEIHYNFPLIVIPEKNKGLDIYSYMINTEPRLPSLAFEGSIRVKSTFSAKAACFGGTVHYYAVALAPFWATFRLEVYTSLHPDGRLKFQVRVFPKQNIERDHLPILTLLVCNWIPDLLNYTEQDSGCWRKNAVFAIMP